MLRQTSQQQCALAENSIYTLAWIEANWQAQQRLVQTILPEGDDDVAPAIQGRSDVAMT